MKRVKAGWGQRRARRVKAKEAGRGGARLSRAGRGDARHNRAAQGEEQSSVGQGEKGHVMIGRGGTR